VNGDLTPHDTQGFVVDWELPDYLDDVIIDLTAERTRAERTRPGAEMTLPEPTRPAGKGQDAELAR
jgi:hypothetical protein